MWGKKKRNVHTNSYYVYKFTSCIWIHIMYTTSCHIYEFTICIYDFTLYIQIHYMYTNSYIHQYTNSHVFLFTWEFTWYLSFLWFVMCILSILNINSHFFTHLIFFFWWLETSWIRKLAMIYLSLLSHLSLGTNPCLWTMVVKNWHILFCGLMLQWNGRFMYWNLKFLHKTYASILLISPDLPMWKFHIWNFTHVFFLLRSPLDV